MEHKFIPGTWIVPKEQAGGKGALLYISSVPGACHYNVVDINGTFWTFPRLEIDTKWREWNIETDVEDGDILREESCIFIVEKYGKNFTKVHCCFFYDDGEFNIGCMLSFDKPSTRPASWGERVLLFEKMDEAGYAWHPVAKALVKKNEYCPAFRNDDWIAYNGASFFKGSESPLHIDSVLEESYLTETQTGDFKEFKHNCIDSCYHRWTVSDARDGDFVASADNIYIFKKASETGETFSAYCGVTRVGCFCGSCWDGIGSYNILRPASSAERELLLDSLSKYGLKWNANDKTIVLANEENRKIAASASAEDSQSMPEKDLGMLDNLRESVARNISEFQDVLDWLDSVREKVLWKPTAEQLKRLEECVGAEERPSALEELLENLRKFA